MPTGGAYQDQHHLGRDAAIGAGAVGAGGLAEHQHHKHHQQQQQQQQQQAMPAGGVYQDQHHLGRDAAIGAGAIGAGGLAEHQYHKHHQQQQATPAGAVAPGSLDDYGKTTVPQGPGATNGQYDSTTGHHKDHHVGRDTALGAGAVGVAEHEHHKHEHEHERDAATQKPRRKSLLQKILHPGKNKDDSTVAAAPVQDEPEHHEHHVGRDAAIGAGAVGAGVAAHEHHKKHEQERESARATGAPATSQHVEPQHKEKGSVLRQIFNPNNDKYDKTLYGEPGASTQGTTHTEPIPTTRLENQHRIPREAAIGVGAAGAGVAIKEHEKFEKHEDPAAEPVESEEVSHHQKKPRNLLRKIFHPKPGKHDTASSEQPDTVPQETVDRKPVPQRAEHHNHLGRDAALGTGAVGAGVAAHEHHKHQQERDVANVAPAAPVTSDAMPVQQEQPQQKPKEKGGILRQIFNPRSGKHDTTQPLEEEPMSQQQAPPLQQQYPASHLTGVATGPANVAPAPLVSERAAAMGSSNLPQVHANGGKFIEGDTNTIPR
jgi:hypothetical protein